MEYTEHVKYLEANKGLILSITGELDLTIDSPVNVTHTFSHKYSHDPEMIMRAHDDHSDLPYIAYEKLKIIASSHLDYSALVFRELLGEDYDSAEISMFMFSVNEDTRVLLTRTNAIFEAHPKSPLIVYTFEVANPDGATSKFFIALWDGAPQDIEHSVGQEGTGLYDRVEQLMPGEAQEARVALASGKYKTHFDYLRYKYRNHERIEDIENLIEEILRTAKERQEAAKIEASMDLHIPSVDKLKDILEDIRLINAA